MALTSFNPETKMNPNLPKLIEALQDEVEGISWQFFREDSKIWVCATVSEYPNTFLQQPHLFRRKPKPRELFRVYSCHVSVGTFDSLQNAIDYAKEYGGEIVRFVEAV